MQPNKVKSITQNTYENHNQPSLRTSHYYTKSHQGNNLVLNLERQLLYRIHNIHNASGINLVPQNNYDLRPTSCKIQPPDLRVLAHAFC